MPEDNVKRRLAAILAADVVGFSRLVGINEEGTIARLKAIRADLIDPRVEQHHGRVFKTTGDGILAEFGSVVDAVRCSVDIQEEMRGRESDIPEDQRIRLRIGVNLGDIIIDGEDILGDGVNIAARLEGLAEPGGVCISAKVHEEVHVRLELVFEDAGRRRVKNIERPVHVWQWSGYGTGRAMPALELPDKPSIAVLPFQNMSADPEQEYFSDGVTEDIITELSKLRWLFVTSRNSSFT